MSEKGELENNIPIENLKVKTPNTVKSSTVNSPTSEITSNEEDELPPFTHYSWLSRIDKNAVKLSIMIILVGLFFVAELVVGFVGGKFENFYDINEEKKGSLALVSDSFHMLSDEISLFVGIIAVAVNFSKKI